MLPEVSNSIKATLYDRAASPLSGMFILSWLVWNWKLFLILIFADYGVDKRIAVITESYINPYDNIVYPLISTAVFVFLYPLISILPTQMWEWANAYKIRIKHRYSLEVPLTVAQSIIIRQEIQQEKLQLNGIVDEFRLKYEHERATASELGQQVLNLEKQLQQAKAIIQDLQNVPVSPEDEFDAGFTISTWNQQIKDYVAKAPSGSLMTLKEIIPQHDWVKVPEGRRKVLGKQFKQIVDNGGFDGITAIAEKTSSNEQLYIKST